MVLVFVKSVDGRQWAFDLALSSTVRQLKRQVSKSSGVRRKQQRLLFRGNVLKDEKTLQDCEVQKECTVQLFVLPNHQMARMSRSLSETPRRRSRLSSAFGTYHDRVSPHLQFGDMILIQLIEGRDLKKSDFWTSSSDPYVILAIGSNSAKSRIIKRNLNPVWNEMFVFLVDSAPQEYLTGSPPRLSRENSSSTARASSTATSLFQRLRRRRGSQRNEESEMQVLEFLVYDHDTFTSDDFLGRAGLRLDHLPLDTVVDLWIPLSRVDTGHLHVKMRRCALASPRHRQVVQRLQDRERALTVRDLRAQHITLEQLVGEEAWVCADLSNPAIEHLVAVAVADQCDWNHCTLRRVETILQSQHMLPTRGPPTRFVWFGGLNFCAMQCAGQRAAAGPPPPPPRGVRENGKGDTEVDEEDATARVEMPDRRTEHKDDSDELDGGEEAPLRGQGGVREEDGDEDTNGGQPSEEQRSTASKHRQLMANIGSKSGFLTAVEQYATPKRCFLSKTQTLAFALVEFKSVRDALLVFIMFQHRRIDDRRMLLGFGRHLPHNSRFLRKAKLAGFLNIYDASKKEWKLEWCVLSENKLHCFHNLQSEEPSQVADLRGAIICSRGPSSVEIYNKNTGSSHFVYSHNASELKIWLGAFEHAALQAFVVEEPGSSAVVSPLRNTHNENTGSPESQSGSAPSHKDDTALNAKQQTTTAPAVVQNSGSQCSPSPVHEEEEEKRGEEEAVGGVRTTDSDLIFQCARCRKRTPIEDMYCPDPQPAPSCLDCLRRDILEKLECKQADTTNSDADADADADADTDAESRRDAGTETEEEQQTLHDTYSINDLRELLRPAEFNSYLDLALRDLLARGEHFIRCPECAATWEFVPGQREQDAPDFESLQGLDNRLLSEESQMHFLSCRACCRRCATNFCRQCGEIPYHSGFSCERFQVYKVAKKCRFCLAALMPEVVALDPPSEALAAVCNNPLCIEKRDQSCTRRLGCGHPCGGVRGEKECLPCLHAECDNRPLFIQQSADQYCTICFTQALGEAPCVCLDCGHVFHEECVLKRVAEKGSGPQITFGFVNCPLCNVKMSHVSLSKALESVQEVYKDIEKRAYFQLKEDGMQNMAEFSDRASEWHSNAIGYAMKQYAFYNCYVCHKPYYGGMVRCLDGLDAVNASDFICPACSGIGLDSCSVHGRDYMIYKCRFCCSVASYFCWGTTHFCPSCHKRQENHDYMTTKTKEQLAQCEGLGQCPLGLEHPPNGEEFSLGCSLCRGADSFKRMGRVNASVETDDNLPNPDREARAEEKEKEKENEQS